MNYSSLNSLWDISQAPSQFSQLPDDDFLALLQKQFPPADPSDHSHSVDPQSVLDRRQSPPSDDSSPSPPSITDATSRRQSIHVRTNDTDDAPLKRKASSDDMEPGPSSKNQHTGLSFPTPDLPSLITPSLADESNPAKKPQPSRRKSTGNSQVCPSLLPCHRPCPLIVAPARRNPSAQAQGTEQSCPACISRAKGETCQGRKCRMHCPCLTCLISLPVGGQGGRTRSKKRSDRNRKHQSA